MARWLQGALRRADLIRAGPIAIIFASRIAVIDAKIHATGHLLDAGAIMSARQGWLFLRYTRWLLWFAFLGYCIEMMLNRQQHLNAFGNLLLTTEFWLFSLPVAAVFVGFFEMLTRDKAGISRSRATDHKVGLGR